MIGICKRERVSARLALTHERAMVLEGNGAGREAVTKGKSEGREREVG